MASPPVYPVAAFRESATAFQAALEACLEEPKARAVHQLRTGTRRLEAILSILIPLKGLPKHKRAAHRLERRLAKVRRRAGELRDFDVSEKLLDKHLPPDAMYSGQINQANALLYRELMRRRERSAKRLSAFLKRRHKKISSAVDNLLHALDGAEGFALPLDALLRFVDARYLSDHSVGMTDPSLEQMHSIRKAAKAARYAAEIAANPRAAEAAQRYEALQEAGGQWHDWHMLSAFATAELGEDHPIAGAFAHLADRELEAFRATLARDRQQNAPVQKQ